MQGPYGRTVGQRVALVCVMVRRDGGWDRGGVGRGTGVMGRVGVGTRDRLGAGAVAGLWMAWGNSQQVGRSVSEGVGGMVVRHGMIWLNATLAPTNPAHASA